VCQQKVWKTTVVTLEHVMSSTVSTSSTSSSTSSPSLPLLFSFIPVDIAATWYERYRREDGWQTHYNRCSMSDMGISVCSADGVLLGLLTFSIRIIHNYYFLTVDTFGIVTCARKRGLGTLLMSVLNLFFQRYVVGDCVEKKIPTVLPPATSSLPVLQLEHTFSVKFTENVPLGMKVGKGGSNTTIVTKVRKGNGQGDKSLAEQNDIQVGDIFIELNGISLKDMENAAVVSLMKLIGRPLHIKFLRLIDVSHDAGNAVFASSAGKAGNHANETDESKGDDIHGSHPGPGSSSSSSSSSNNKAVLFVETAKTDSASNFWEHVVGLHNRHDPKIKAINNLITKDGNDDSFFVPLVNDRSRCFLKPELESRSFLLKKVKLQYSVVKQRILTLPLPLFKNKKYTEGHGLKISKSSKRKKKSSGVNSSSSSTRTRTRTSDGVSTHEIACTPPEWTIGVPWNGVYEKCVVVREDSTTFDVKISSDGAVCRKVLKMYVRPLGVVKKGESEPVQKKRKTTVESTGNEK
jgi:hypothetical protein